MYVHIFAPVSYVFILSVFLSFVSIYKTDQWQLII